MLYASMMLLLVSAAFTPTNASGHSSAEQKCSCAQYEPDAPFTIDCDAPGPIRQATATLDSTCKAVNGEYEWGGIFATPLNAYEWKAQAVGGAYADASMKLVLFSTTGATKADLIANAAAARTLMAGTCTDVNTGGSIPAPTSTGACYKLMFPAANVDFTATVDATNVANIAAFAEHVPTEFERDTHYFLDTAGTDIEPAAETDAEEYNGREYTANGIKVRRLGSNC